MAQRKHTPSLILILGDQLSPGMSSLKVADKDRDVVLMVEVADEATYVHHHKKKIALIFSAMRHFAEELAESGWTVDYVTLDAAGNTGSFTGEVARAVTRHKLPNVIVTEPGEWRVLEAMKSWQGVFGVPVTIIPDTRFIASRDQFAAWARDKKQLRMEYFYREMRRQTGLLMNGNNPEGGAWNFDHDNRKAAKPDLFLPAPLRIPPDDITTSVLQLVSARFSNHFGTLEPFWFAVTRRDAERAFDHFLATALPRFGDFQDAMLAQQKFLYHAVISAYINCGLLDPLHVCQRAEQEYRAGRAPLNAVEGFIRQIIGWREYVRGIYWLKMPGYENVNALDHHRPLPDFYWTAETEMRCVKEAVTQTRDEAYAHHIQRLMVTGNFALLAGIDPHALHRWYLAVYADAYEWVELPNTIGMSQFADGGLLASKPYVASGAYIDRMSDYCKSCRYDVKKRTGPDACPYNPLYWNFLATHRATLEKNPRMAQMYRVYDKFPADEKNNITKSANAIIQSLKPSVIWPDAPSTGGTAPSST